MALPKVAIKTYTTTLPHSGQEVEFRPYLVKEERALLMANQDENESEMLKATLNLVSACTLTEGVEANKLAEIDLQWLFMQLRSKSVGEDVEFMNKCSECEKEFQVRFDLQNVHVEHNPDHTLSYRVETGEEDLMIEFSLPTAQTYLEASKIKNEVEQAFYLIESCIQKITYDGNIHVRGQDFEQGDVSAFFGELPGNHLDRIFTKVFQTAPKIVQRFNIRCPHCQVEKDYEVEGLTNFFG